MIRLAVSFFICACTCVVYGQNAHSGETLSAIDSLEQCGKHFESYKLLRDTYLKTEIVRQPLLALKYIELSERLNENEEAADMAHNLLKSTGLTKAEKAEVYILLARLNEKLGNLGLCRDELRRAKRLIDESGQDSLLPTWYSRSASYNRLYGSKDLALHYAQLGVKTAEKQQNFPEKATNQFLVAFLTKDPSQREQLLRSALNQYVHMNESNGASAMYLSLYRHYSSSGQGYRKPLLDSAFFYFRASGIQDMGPSIMQEYLDYYKKIGDGENAFLYVDSVLIASNKLRNIQNTVSVYSLEKNFEEKQLKGQLEQERQRVINAQLEEDRTRSERNLFLLLSIILILFLSFLVYHFTRQRKTKNLLKKEVKQRLETNESLEKSLETNRLLMKEMMHRVKNGMQVVSSLLSIQSRFVSPEARPTLQECKARIEAFNIAHQNLYTGDEIDEIYLDVYLKAIVAQVLHTGVDINFDVEHVKVVFEKGQALGLIVHEFVMNSIKYAWPDEPKGRQIGIVVRQEGTDVRLIYHDNGIGLTKDYEQRKSVGFWLINAFIKNPLNGTSTISGEKGFRGEILFAL